MAFFNLSTEIYTDRLALKKVTIEDHVFLLQLLNTAGWLRFIGDKNVHSEEDAMAYIQLINDRKDFTYLVARLKADNKPVGVVSFIKRDYLEHFDIGFALLPEFCGHGYAFEAAKEVLSIKARQPEHQIIVATVMAQNNSSIGLLVKLGFQYVKEIVVDGELLQLYSFSANPPDKSTGN